MYLAFNIKIDTVYCWLLYQIMIAFSKNKTVLGDKLLIINVLYIATIGAVYNTEGSVFFSMACKISFSHIILIVVIFF